jgi:hypothetical protein
VYRIKDNNHLYVGRAGHLVSMAECLSRGWNVAIPEVDIGEDIFVVEDETNRLAKVQVKTASGRSIKNGFCSQFIISLKQLSDTTEKGNDLRFIFVTRFNKKWQPFVVITRKELYDKHHYENVGSINKNEFVKITIYFLYEKNNLDQIGKVECGTKRGFSKSDFSKFLNRWEQTFFTPKIKDS